jgi:hypothetical protein
MLEAGDMLHTWALRELPRAWQVARSVTAAIDPECPAAATGNVVDADQLGFHRHEYLEFQGSLSGDRGQVHRIDRGTYVTAMKSTHEWRIRTEGGRLQGEITLLQSPDDAEKWLLRCEQ